MSCETIEPELIGYHFATLEPATRRRVEEHLLTCDACVRAYVTLKRDIELGEDEAAPSEASRLKLRRAVMAELSGQAARPWRWWERPFAFGFAAASVALALFAVALVATGPGAPSHSFVAQVAVRPGAQRYALRSTSARGSLGAVAGRSAPTNRRR